MKKRKQELELMIENGEKEIVEMSKTKGKSVKKELELKKQQLDLMDESRRKLYILKSNLSSLNSRLDEKQRQNQKLKTEYDYTFSKLQSMESEIIIKDSLDSHREKIVILKSRLETARKDKDNEIKQKIMDDKTIAVLEKGIEDQIKIQSQVASLDICPLCKTKITQEHISHVVENAEKEKISNTNNIDHLKSNIKSIEEKIIKINAVLNQLEDEIKVRSQDVLRLELVNEKKETLRKLSEEIKLGDREFIELTRKRELLENDISSIKTSESNYDSLRLEVQEMTRHEEASVGMEVTLKQRDIERNKNIMKQIVRELEEASLALNEINKTIEDKQAILDEKTDQDTSIKERFKRTLEEKNQHQEKIHFYERDLMHKNNEKHMSEERINTLKIERAQYAAQKEAIEQESREFKEAKILRMSIEELRKKLDETLRII